MTVTGPVGTVSRNRPSASDVVACGAPSTETVAPTSGVELPTAVTVPVITRVCPHAAAGSMTMQVTANTERLLRTVPPDEVDRSDRQRLRPLTEPKGADEYVTV